MRRCKPTSGHLYRIARDWRPSQLSLMLRRASTASGGSVMYDPDMRSAAVRRWGVEKYERQRIRRDNADARAEAGGRRGRAQRAPLPHCTRPAVVATLAHAAAGKYGERGSMMYDDEKNRTPPTKTTAARHHRPVAVAAAIHSGGGRVQRRASEAGLRTEESLLFPQQQELKNGKVIALLAYGGRVKSRTTLFTKIFRAESRPISKYRRRRRRRPEAEEARPEAEEARLETRTSPHKELKTHSENIAIGNKVNLDIDMYQRRRRRSRERGAVAQFKASQREQYTAGELGGDLRRFSETIEAEDGGQGCPVVNCTKRQRLMGMGVNGCGFHLDSWRWREVEQQMQRLEMHVNETEHCMGVNGCGFRLDSWRWREVEWQMQKPEMHVNETEVNSTQMQIEFTQNRKQQKHLAWAETETEAKEAAAATA
ncbi:hypothetical protein K438DRAFT_2153049 [Mycena galopus ATCC 62051]|nr:hypothetical protein K438DRAFT_2153049 [Mycena galopus ATCC 62051]